MLSLAIYYLNRAMVSRQKSLKALTTDCKSDPQFYVSPCCQVLQNCLFPPSFHSLLLSQGNFSEFANLCLSGHVKYHCMKHVQHLSGFSVMVEHNKIVRGGGG